MPFRRNSGSLGGGVPQRKAAVADRVRSRRYPSQIFVAEERATSSSYDATALAGFDDQAHRVIVLNDVKGVNQKAHNLFRKLTDGMVLKWNFSGKSYAATPAAKVVLNSTEPPPQDLEFLRRYTWARTDAAGEWEVVSEAGSHGAIEPGSELQLAGAIRPASDYLALLHLPRGREFRPWSVPRQLVSTPHPMGDRRCHLPSVPLPPAVCSFR